MKKAFLSWQDTSKSLVRFKFVSSVSNSDIEVEFVDFVRPEKKFKSEKELIKQIKKDISSLKSLQ